MEKIFNLNIFTPESLVYSGKIVSLVAPSSKGYLGALTNHDNLISDISRGKITLKEADGSIKVFNSRGKGFLEISQNNAELLLDLPPTPQ